MNSDASNKTEASNVHKSPRNSTDSEDWENYTAYQCRHCGENCINPRVTQYAKRNLCLDCFTYSAEERRSQLEERRFAAMMARSNR